MRTILLILLILGVAFGLIIYGAAKEMPAHEYVYTINTDAEPEVSALSWGIYDTRTGKLLMAHGEHEVHPIASLTKLFTADVALDTLALEASTTLSWRAVSTEGRTGNLKTGEIMNVRELLFPLLIESSNDAAEALAEYDDRAVFISHMNTQAKDVGLQNTFFHDPSGLSPKNVSTVADLSMFITHLAESQPYLLDITSLRAYIGEKHSWWNVNPLVVADTFRGGKHGYTEEADRTLAGIFEESFPSGETTRITIILLGSNNLAKDTETLRTFIREHVDYK